MGGLLYYVWVHFGFEFSLWFSICDHIVVSAPLGHSIFSGNSVKQWVFFFNPWIKCLWKVSISLYDNFPGQTELTINICFTPDPQNRKMFCQNCGCAKHFLRKGLGCNLGFDFVVCNTHQNHEAYVKCCFVLLSHASYLI